MQESYYWDLIKKYLEKNTNSTENQELERWISQSEDNLHHFEVQKNLWNHTSTKPLHFNPEKGWDDLKLRIEEGRESQVIPLNRILKIAASIALLLVFCALIKSLVWDTTRYVTITAPAYENLRVVLPDRSIVWLNRNSVLKYPKKFEGKERQVNLSGEAFFEIQKDKRRPFRITSEGTITEVLGTSFNIKATKEDEVVEVSVFTGTVAFYNEESKDQKLILIAGNTGVFKKDEELMEKLTKKNLNVLSWKTGLIKFQSAPLTEVVEKLQDQYSKKIVLKNQDLLKCSITSEFDNVPLEKVLDELQLMLNIKYSLRDQEVILSGGNCH